MAFHRVCTHRPRGAGLGEALSRVLQVAAVCALAAACSSAERAAGVDPDLGVSPSPRVVTSGPVPKGGGRRHVGKPYRIGGKWYTPRENPEGYSKSGLASWYGDAFHGRQTANGEVFDMAGVTAAHPTLPLPSYVKVTNLDNGRAVTVRVNDRGPYHSNRVIDVSRRAADALGFRHRGIARVQVDYLRAASLAGSDDARLLATLTQDGRALGAGGTSLVASAKPVPAWTPKATASQGAEQAVAVASAEAPGRLPRTRPQGAPAASPSPDDPIRLALAETPDPSPPTGATGYAPSAPAGQGFYLQAGTFRDGANAARLGERLAAHGAIETTAIQVDGERMTRVVAGPFAGRGAAEAALSEARAAGAAGARLVAF